MWWAVRGHSSNNMDDDFLKLYEEELGHIREMGAEFGRQYPRIAGRLGMAREGCDDPFVERMIEGFAFLAARVRKKLDAEYPKFCESLMETVYPLLLAPVPSMTIVELFPDDKLEGAFEIPRGTLLTSHLASEQDTRCEFRTAHDVTLRPVRIDAAEPPRYYTRDIERLRLSHQASGKAALRLRIAHMQGDKMLSAIEDFSELTVHIAGNLAAAGVVFEEILSHCQHVCLRPVDEAGGIHEPVVLRPGVDDFSIAPIGFEAGESLLPSDPRTFEGYRLLREFSVLPERFLFLKLHGADLMRFFRSCETNAADLIFVFDRSRDEMIRHVDKERFRLFATPAINLFERRADQVQLGERFHEAHVVVDKTRPLAYEVFEILAVRGVGERSGGRINFEPFYRSGSNRGGTVGFFTMRREPRRRSVYDQRFGGGASYTGSEVFLSVVDEAGAVHRDEVSGLSVRVLCSNRHLPLCIPIREHETDFFTDAGLPVRVVRCLTSPTRPIEAAVGEGSAWRMISHLSLNYLSLVDEDGGVEALREIAGIYTQGVGGDESHWTSGLAAVSSKPVVRRHLGTGPVAFIRGLQVTLEVDEAKMAGASAYVLGAVLARFFARYVSINSFVETRLISGKRGEIACWGGVDGKLQIL